MKADLLREESERGRKERGRRAQARERENENLDRKRNESEREGEEIYSYRNIFQTEIKKCCTKTECNNEKGAEGVGLGRRKKRERETERKKKWAGLVRLIAPELCRKNKLSCRMRAELGWAEEGMGIGGRRKGGEGKGGGGGDSELISKAGRSLGSRSEGLAHNIKGH